MLHDINRGWLTHVLAPLQCAESQHPVNGVLCTLP